MSNTVTVTNLSWEGIAFSDGTFMSSDHCQSCCEKHFLDFENVSRNDFEGLEFDLSGMDFFERVEGFGIRLLPLNGHPVPIAGYGYNNGYYSDDLTLVLSRGDVIREIDITSCQEIEY